MKIYKHNIEAKQAIKDGIDKAVNIIKVTLGPIGHSVIIQNPFGIPTITDDGVSVAKAIELEDEFEQMGAALVLDVANKTNEKTGDGTTTASVLTQAIVNNVFDSLTLFGSKSNEIQIGMKKTLELILNKLKKQKTEIKGSEQIQQIAYISSLDQEASEFITDCFNELGPQGVIILEEGQTEGLEKVIVKGMQFDKGYLSPYFVTDKDKMEANIENPLILVTEKKITTLQQLLPIIQKVVETERPLMIISDEIGTEVLGNLVVNKTRGVLNILAVKSPGFGDKKREYLEDIAALVNAKLILDDNLSTLDIPLTDLGTAKRIITSKDKTTIINGAGNVTKRIQELKENLKSQNSSYEQEKLKERISKLSGGIAIIKVGGSTETEMKARKFKIEDAINATKAAIEEGVVAGGGLALASIKTEDKDFKGLNKFEMIGANALLNSIVSPLNQIAENMGITGEELEKKIKKDSKIIDPYKVVRLALENAASVAMTLISMEAAIVDKKE